MTLVNVSSTIATCDSYIDCRHRVSAKFSMFLYIIILATVADPGFLEGGFYYNVAREARAKFLEATPIFE